MSVLRKIPMIHEYKSFMLDNCEVFLHYRKIRILFPHSNNTFASIFQLLHMNVWGPYKLETYDGITFFIVLFMIILYGHEFYF